MNTNFSSLGFESNSNFYNPDWNNHSVDWVQHDSTSGGEQFPTTHINNLAGRANQLMVAMFAHAPFSHTIAPPKSCSYCFNPSHHAHKCPFIRHYMIDEDDSSNPHHEHVQATTTLGSEEVVEEIVNEPSLEDPLEESFAHLKFDLDLDMIHEQAEDLLDSTENGKTTEISAAAEEEEKDLHF
jgi:hypothetical protein